MPRRGEETGRRRTLLPAGCALFLLAATWLGAACGQIPEERWQVALANARAVPELVHERQYTAAQRRWGSVDDVIHAAYPRLQKEDPDLAKRLWAHMVGVEVGFLQADWQAVEENARPLAGLLEQAHRLLMRK